MMPTAPVNPLLNTFQFVHTFSARHRSTPESLWAARQMDEHRSQPSFKPRLKPTDGMAEGFKAPTVLSAKNQRLHDILTRPTTA